MENNSVALIPANEDAVFKSLEIQLLAINNKDDSEYTEAYLAFRRRANDFIKYYSSQHSSEVKFGDLFMLEKLKHPLSDFYIHEGIKAIWDLNQLIICDPAPFQDMVQYIINNSDQPKHQESNYQSLELTKRNHSEIITKCIQGIGHMINDGILLNTMKMNLTEWLTPILQSIDMNEKKNQIRKDTESHSVQIKKSGTILIGTYNSNLDIHVEKKCCCRDYQKMTLDTDVKMWQYSTMADLKETYLSLVKMRLSEDVISENGTAL